MTNLQKGIPVLSARSLRRLWFGAPAAALGLVSLLMVAAVLAPLWQAMQRDSSRVRELEDLQVQVSLMRQQLRTQDVQEEKALEQRAKLFRMIAGSGDVSTLLAVLDREAKASGVRLNLYEPQTAATPAASPAPAPAAANQQKPPPANPLATAGLKAQGMLISAQGSYPNLLSFLRRLESLNLLVIQSDLNLEAPAASSDKTKPTSQDVTMKLRLQVYGKPGTDEPEANPPATAAPSPAAPGAGRSGAPPPAAANPGAPAPAAQPGSAPAATPAANGAAPAAPGNAGAAGARPAGR